MIEHVLARLVSEAQSTAVTIVRIDLARFDASFDDEHKFLRELATRLALEKGHIASGEKLKRWARGTAKLNFEHLLREAILPHDDGALVLCLDSVQKILATPWGKDTLAFFRSLLQDRRQPWPALRLVLATSRCLAPCPPMLTSPLPNIAEHICLPGFSQRQVRELSYRYGVSWDECTPTDLIGVVGGHPFLLSFIMLEARLRGTPLKDFCKPDTDARRRLRDRVWMLLPDLHPWLHELKKLLQNLKAPLSVELDDLLQEWGLTTGTGKSRQFRGAVFREVLEELVNGRRPR
jgi:serine/threonine-protein kinase